MIERMDRQNRNGHRTPDPSIRRTLREAGTPEPEDELVLVIEPEPSLVATARAFAASLARSAGMDEVRIHDLKIAISEIIANSIKAHRASGSSEPVRIVARPARRSLVFEVIDSGGGFDLSAVVRQPVDDPAFVSPGGVGILILETLFPDTTIEPNATGGTTVRFTVGEISMENTGDFGPA